MELERMGAQAAKLGLPYPERKSVVELLAAGFVVDDWIPRYAVYRRLFEGEKVHPVGRSAVADPEYFFVWRELSPLDAVWEETMRAIDREILDELCGKTRAPAPRTVG